MSTSEDQPIATSTATTDLSTLGGDEGGVRDYLRRRADAADAGRPQEVEGIQAEIDDAIAEVQPPREVVPRDSSDSKEHALRAARICEDFRGSDIVVLDLTRITPEFDFFVIATAGSRRQMHAVVDEVDRALEHSGHKRRSIEGYDTTPWIVQDYGDVVLHVFLEEARELYDLENLWGDAPRVAWQAAEKTPGE